MFLAMHDIKYIRNNPQEFDKQLARRGFKPLSTKILELDSINRGNKTNIQKLQEEANKLAKQVGDLMAQGKREEAAPLLAKSKQLKAQIQNAKDSAEQGAEEDNSELENFLATLPNILDASVPDGKSEDDNLEVKKFGTPRKFDFTPKAHFEVGEDLNLLDFEKTAKISGARFASYYGNLAKLERALASFMLDVATSEFGYTEVAVPFLVKADAAFGTGQLPKFEEDLFKTTNDYYLIPTAEIPVTNLVRDSILEEKELPLRYTAYTPCFRSEAGSAGKDTRGLVRMHQFSKVELVSITTPEKSADEHERLTSCAEEILKKLELPYRLISLCSGDIGFGASKTYDIEVWLPAQNKYREISSCSNFKDFQARRMKARFRRENGTVEPVHTLNGSSLAVGRTIVAILENYQQSDGTVLIPEILKNYMNGVIRLEKRV
jgi:seryl-tRNA synthetase